MDILCGWPIGYFGWGGSLYQWVGRTWLYRLTFHARVGDAVVTADNKATLDERCMRLGESYHFVLDGVALVAIKQADGAVDVYQCARQ